MEKSALIDSDVNYDWNFLNYPIHTVSAKPEQYIKRMCNFINSWFRGLYGSLEIQYPYFE